MSEAGVAAARALVDDVNALLDRLTPADWAADSACHGWRVHDVVTHLGFFFNFIADPNLVLPENPSGTSERLNDAAVRERADWSSQQAIGYYREQSVAGLAALEALQGAEMRDVPLTMLDLGTFRMGQLADAVAFDHLVHLSCDLIAPFGPVSPTEVSLSAAIDPAIDWMIAGLPQMNGAAVARALTRPIGLRLTGATERSFVLSRDTDSSSLLVTETDAVPDDLAVTSATDFLRWATTRSAWRSAVTLTGDHPLIAWALDEIDIV
ncbi:maleylpyruvate isomerase N-terminal domain-containing protein [Nocardia sp. NPDC052254]|uniref:maleylpyruvate isomerase N-terminal domain-containing protein n=1 Tax=Nocardia sp. NPDC052254 TaxID=3155681 RepID=UPI003430CF0C